MSVTMRQPITIDEFLAWEEGQELRWEFDGYAPVAMTGGTAGHIRIQRNITLAIAPRLRGSGCELYTSDMKVVLKESVRYPDAFVACSSVPHKATFVTDPVVVFEVLSDSTARTDHFDKNREYQAAKSIRRYVMLEQDSVGATVFARVGDDWVGHVLGADAVLDMPELGIAVPLIELYEGVDFSAAAPG